MRPSFLFEHVFDIMEIPQTELINGDVTTDIHKVLFVPKITN